MRTLLMVLALLLIHSWSAAAEPLGLAFGAYAAISSPLDEPIWMAGLLLAAGPSEGVQVRLGTALAWPDQGTLLHLETLVLFNFRLGAWVYLGGGIGLTHLITGEGTEMTFPVLAAAGLKTRPLAHMPWRFFVEGKLLWHPIQQQDAQLDTQWGAGVLISF
jgi:hypothetical protein